MKKACSSRRSGRTDRKTTLAALCVHGCCRDDVQRVQVLQRSVLLFGGWCVEFCVRCDMGAVTITTNT